MVSVVAAPLRRRSAPRLLHGFATDRRCRAVTTLTSIMVLGQGFARSYARVWIEAALHGFPAYRGGAADHLNLPVVASGLYFYA